LGHGFLDHNTSEISISIREFLDNNKWPEKAL